MAEKGKKGKKKVRLPEMFRQIWWFVLIQGILLKIGIGTNREG